MRRCLYSKCTVEFEPRRPKQLYCCDNHRVYAGRERRRSEAAQQQQQRLANFNRMVNAVRIRWGDKAARRVQRIATKNGLECGEDCVKLLLEADLKVEPVQPQRQPA